MLDVKQLTDHFDEISQKLQSRGFQLDRTRFFSLSSECKKLHKVTQELQTRRNQISQTVAIAKSKQKDLAEQDISALIKESAQIGAELKEQLAALQRAQTSFLQFQYTIPNIPDESVPKGNSEAKNRLVRAWGEQPAFDFTPKDHVALGELFGEMDFKSAARLSGARFVVLQGKLARLQRALGSWMLDVHIRDHHYQEVAVPYLVHEACLYGTGQLPKFRDDQFQISGDDDLFLIPTGEVSLVNLVREQILESDGLPKKWVAQTPCFRREAGSYGQDVYGMIRQHQFQKVELVQVVIPDDSYAALEELTKEAEKILQLLELPYRVVALCTGDLGFSAAKTYDLEVWLPGQNRYREISSCSHCTDFQTRRMKTRWRHPTSKRIEYPHTLNGSALAVGRALIAVMENYQTTDGRIRIPAVLKGYFPGEEYL